MVDKIREYQEIQKEDTLEYGIAELLIQIAEENQKAAEIIVADLDQEEMDLSAAAKHLWKYASKHKNNSQYAMTERKAIELLKEFYGLTELETEKTVPQQKYSDFLNLEDLL